MSLCLYVDVCYLQRTEEGIRSLELEKQVVESLLSPSLTPLPLRSFPRPRECWELNRGPRPEQPVLLNTKPSLQL